MKASVEKLEAARALIARLGGWCQGSMAQDVRGVPVKARSPSAVCFCTNGALSRVNGGKDEADAFRKATGSGLSIFVWNDCLGRKQSDVILAFDRAIELARGAS